LAHFTTWNGSAARIAWGQLAATESAMYGAASAVTWVINAHRVGPRASKNLCRVALDCPVPAQTSRPVSWSMTTVRNRWPRR
jgi:hypothetical protein